MNNILLLGAGFSRNWGGWLGDEVFEYLLGHPDIVKSQHIISLLWKHKDSGGFENALAELQRELQQNKTDKARMSLSNFQKAISQMFNDMESIFGKQDLFGKKLQNFLFRFDAIFTLNQDLLLEEHYQCGHSLAQSASGNKTQLRILHSGSPEWPKEWMYWETPGMVHPEVTCTAPHRQQISDPRWKPAAPDEFKVSDKMQPIFKLHGSSNWRTDDDEELLIMGGNKDSSIKTNSILAWYFRKFEEYLFNAPTNLMIIGYSFRDEHINKTLCAAAEAGGLGIFIIDPEGVDVISKTNKTKQAAIYVRNQLEDALNPRIVGASRRHLRTTFETDDIEYRKVMRFFQ